MHKYSFIRFFNNFFACGFLGTSYILWFWLVLRNLLKPFPVLRKTWSRLGFQPQLFQRREFYCFLVVPNFLHSWSFWGAFSVEHPKLHSALKKSKQTKMKGHFLWKKNWKRNMVTIGRDNAKKTAQENNFWSDYSMCVWLLVLDLCWTIKRNVTTKRNLDQGNVNINA